MARKSVVIRENRKKECVEKYREKRIEIKNQVRLAKSITELREAQIKLARLPKNSNPVRHTTRCQQCGRAHAVYRKFGLCRICLRQELMTGNVAGGRKSSW